MSYRDLTDDVKRAIFKDLASVSQWEAGRRHNLDTMYKNKSTVVQTVAKIKNEVLQDPERFRITPEVIDLVEKALKDRKENMSVISQNSMIPTLASDSLEDMEIKDLVVRGSKRAWIGLNKALDTSLRNQKAMNRVPLGTWAKVAGIAFDKGQIVAGQATEHIELKARISKDLSPAERIELVLKMREAMSAEKRDGK